ncbi:hypothetical protein ACFYXM_12870 [Streptomyces sp. NPDC002476]|uniref:hypothetical protein n=1 Tax=Streptomyces sp. NPDC002476 TaxID=3364648 RepID=UPI003689D76A
MLSNENIPDEVLEWSAERSPLTYIDSHNERTVPDFPTTRRPAASYGKPVGPGADTPLVITAGHQRAGFLREPTAVEYESPPVNRGRKMA